jgi:signal transduction histidine kinase/ABC-type amino acid transport substrate-binding protein
MVLTVLFTIHHSLFTAPAAAQQIHEYTEEQPLVIVSDWEFPPYEFSNDKGEPDGYNIEILNMILDRLHIPHRYVMQEWYMAIETFEHREADLIFALSFNYMKRPYVMTRNLLHFYRIVSVRRPDEKPLTSIGLLGKEDTLIMKTDDYAPIRILMTNPDPPFTIEYHSPKDALTGVQRGIYDYFLWGEIPIQRKLKEFALDSLVTDLTDIPPGELRLIGYDKDLIDAIDDEYARLEQAGQLEKVYDKWFHPEREHDDTSPIPIFIIVGAIIVGLISLLLSRLIRIRVQKAIHKSKDINNMMTQALSMGNYYVIEHDLKTHWAHNIYGNLLPDEGVTDEEFINRIIPEQRDDFKNTMQKITEGMKSAELKTRWNAGTVEKPDWRYLHGHSIVELEDGSPRYIVNSVKDVTHDIMEERTTRETGERYIKIFKTSLLAMSFYDANQNFIDANDQMRKLCGIDIMGETIYRQTSLEDMPLLLKEFSPESHDEFHVCQHLQIPQAGIDIYIEFRIYPVVDNDHIIYYIVTARDITDERLFYLEQRKHDIEMRKISDAANTYENQLQYLLEKSKMFVWRFSLADKMIHLSRSLRKVDFSFSRKDYYMENIDSNERDSNFDKLYLLMMKGQEFNTIYRFNRTPVSSEPSWHALSGIPIRDSKGNLTGYFGVTRNITELVSIQQKLKEETARAEDSGRLKSLFLANMTHEIRTPLNAIVGFSDLLQVIDTQEERMEFIRIIRNNCDMLLRLINDILEASSMGQALAINPVECDFAQVFDDICQTLAQRVQEPGVEFIKDNPYTTFRTALDKGRVQQVLTNFTTNAVKYTHNGHIKVGYRQEVRSAGSNKPLNGLYFYCEDTGAGIPKEKQASVFERFVKLNDFVQGTGLGLSICKAIAERCGGEIGLTSEGEGHGSTFWLWIPCERIED